MMQPSFKKVQDGAREHPLYYLRPKSIHANHIALSTTKSRVFTASRFSSSFLQHLMAIVTTAIVALSSTDPISSSSDSLSEYHMIECRPKDVYINSLNAEAYEQPDDTKAFLEPDDTKKKKNYGQIKQPGGEVDEGSTWMVKRCKVNQMCRCTKEMNLRKAWSIKRCEQAQKETVVMKCIGRNLEIT
ncbi:hypothetical protein RB195_022528 [Necator americanus]|uniref:Uncharacterized protein n=1 Tax=Necator americanus TaxID=51031 RepID=A0ABR1EGL7_NECAM